MLDHYQHLLLSIVAQPERPVGQLNLLGHQERQQLAQFNDYPATYDIHQTLIQVFEQRVVENPNQIALVFEAEKWTYQELKNEVDHLAAYLQHQKIGEGDLVGVLIEQSPQQIIALLAVIKAGAAYVPIDVTYPEERKQFILKDAQIKWVVCVKKTISASQHWSTNVINIDKILAASTTLSPTSIQASSQAPVYVIYTSGTTGRPKGTLVSHQNVINYIQNTELLRLQPDDRILHWFNFSFDASIWSIFGTLLTGATLYLPGEAARTAPQQIKSFLKRHRISAAGFSSAFFNTLVDYDVNMFQSCRQVMIGGEAASAVHTQRFVQAIGPNYLINEYGPTECTVASTFYSVNSEQYHQVPIGRPINNARIYIVDQEGQLTGIGMIGEIWIGGDGVALGYLNRPELNEEKFILDPFQPATRQRVYKTGDLARWLDHGQIEFIGRRDQQVKIRGYRVELSEIEHCMQQSSLVRQSVVLTQTDSLGNNNLIAYLVPEGQFDKAKLQATLAQQLPEYMVPQVFLPLETLPLDSNGKVNRASLPIPDTFPLESKVFVAPHGDIEIQIAKIWEELLDIEQVGLHDNFFALGGHSLLAIRVIAQMAELNFADLDIRDLFNHPTIAELAKKLEPSNELVDIPLLRVQERPKRIPLSFAQERLWFVDQLNGSLEYHTPNILRIKGALQIGHFQTACQALVHKHEILRTLIKKENGQPYQVITTGENWQVNYLPEAPFEGEQARDAYLQKAVYTPFDLAQEYPLRINLIRLDANDHLLVLVIHHIASDGWSAAILVDEVLRNYQLLHTGAPLPEQPLDIQYADYAIWQRMHYSTEVIQGQLNYWTQQLEDVKPLALPTDFPRPAIQSIRGGATFIELDAAFSEQLLQLAQREGVTPFMLIMSVCQILIARHSNQTDICIGTPVAGRTAKATEALIGCFINTLAIRSQVPLDTPFVDFLQSIKQTTLDAFAHQLVPFEQVVEATGTERDMSRSPIFQVTLTYQNMPEAKEDFSDDLEIDADFMGHLSITTQRDLSFFVEERPHGLAIAINYCLDLYRPETVQQLLLHLENLLHAIVEQPKQVIQQLDLVGQTEREKLIHDFNQTQVAYRREATLASLFAIQVQERPQAIALVCGAKQWTYQELDELANYLAQNLHDQYQIQAGDFVGVLMTRSEWMIISVLSILKLGAAYVPIDPNYPAERKAFIIKDTQIKCLLILSEHLFEVTTFDMAVFALDVQLEPIEESNPVHPILYPGSANDIAYVMYTSGTTGQPKGTLVTQQNVVKLIEETGAIAVQPNDRVLQWSNFAFDGSVYEIFASLLQGASLHLIDEQAAADPKQLAALIREQELTLAFLTTALFNAFVDYDLNALKGLRKILFGGELVSLHHVQKALAVLSPGQLIHVYGPTETTVFATALALEKVEGSTVPIGRPLSNTQIYIVDPLGEIAGLGAVGEIWIGGDNVSQGYLNRVELSAQKFIDNPFGKGKIYKTGDLARWLTNGCIEFIGRQDSQIKMRGYRIELGEIEHALQQLNEVNQAVVLAKKDPSGTQQLIAYLVSNGSFDKTQLQQQLRKHLPEYMVPAILIELSAI
ncbi:MAG: amino acid adenylation domain-containing protein, partial [Bacteroidota bacterium]